MAERRRSTRFALTYAVTQPPFARRRSRRRGLNNSVLDESNLVVGLMPGAQYNPGVATLSPGDRILLFTDGITEAENSRGEQFGATDLEPMLHNAGLDQILLRLAKFQGQQESQDDCTLCELVYRGR